jgi:hypothetical protein
MKARVIISNLTSVHPSNQIIGLDVAADNVECANFFLYFNFYYKDYYKYAILITTQNCREETWLATKLVFYIFSFCVVIKLPGVLFKYLLFCAFHFPFVIVFFIFDNLIS